ncbi:transcription termination factor 4, mitochondrial [Episyrphus balteatus]|uniref:transcription termination factor 4, mitochondrial n=1 Tax=Episyrphus balteatus TaxID=286459 RepID=UPI00248583DB|nr:transcription termination factor 4, mitochondrial [Episyrphus balteatus]
MFTKILKFRTFSTINILPKPFATKPIEYSADTSLEQVHIDEAVKLAPILQAASFDLWKQSHEIFINHGLKTTNFLRIVTGNPSILSRQPKKVIDSLENWRSCQFGETLSYLLLTKYPELLDITDGRKLVKHVTYLKGYLGTNKNVWKLLMNSPDLIKQSEGNIKKKIDYINQTMRIEIPEIVKSEALSRSLFDIQCRHVFLDRLGLFKPRNPKADPDEPTKNPRLYKITDTSDKTFATKIAHVTLAEFEAFEDLYKRELRRKDREQDEDDLEEDDDDEDDYDDDHKI